MQNLNDSPARFEEHQEYLRDPTSNHAKPYSTKQQLANEEHKQKVTLYHETEGRKKFHVDEAEQAMKDGWRDVPFVHPRHPKKKVEVKTEEDAEMKALLSEAERLGVEVDNRWGKNRLKKELLKADQGSDG